MTASPIWEVITITDEMTVDVELELIDVTPVADIPRALEAIFMVADDPQTLVSLATAVGAPVAAVRQAIEALVSDYDGEASGPKRGFELREVGGGRRGYVGGRF